MSDMLSGLVHYPRVVDSSVHVQYIARSLTVKVMSPIAQLMSHATIVAAGRR